MKQQVVKSKQTSPLMGVLLILGMVAGLLVASFLGSLLNLLFHTNWCASIVWLLTALLAVHIMRDRIMEYRYTVANGRFYLERTFGEHYSKVLLNLPLMDILAQGELESLKAAHPEIKFTRRAWLKACPLPKTAYIYRKDGALEFLVAQPDPEMKAAIYDPEKRRETAKDKWG